MKRISITDKGRIEKIYRAMQLAGLNEPQLELLEVNLENLIAEKNKSIILGTDISAKPSEVMSRSQQAEAKKLESDMAQIYGLSNPGTFQQELLSAVKSGNIQCQKFLLMDCYHRTNAHRNRKGLRSLSRNRFLAETRHFLERHGLTLDKELQHLDFHK